MVGRLRSRRADVASTNDAKGCDSTADCRTAADAALKLRCRHGAATAFDLIRRSREASATSARESGSH